MFTQLIIYMILVVSYVRLKEKIRETSTSRVLAYIVVQLVSSSHVVAEAVESIVDVRIVSKVSPSSAIAVAASSGNQGVATEKEQQQGHSDGEVELPVDVW